MPFMPWTDHFITGIDLVDAQHRQLVDRINELAAVLARGETGDATAAGPLLERLLDYAGTHFGTEEGLMREHGIAPRHFEEHHGQHEAFVDEVMGMRGELLASGRLADTRLLRLLTSWLAFHILSTDQVMARQVKLLEGGMSAEAALTATLEAQQNLSAPTALTSALLDMFLLHRERMKDLSRANTELEAAEEALANVNAGLEREVLLRTRELRDANSALLRDRAHLESTLFELKQTQAALLQAEKLRTVGELAAGIAHEINTPLQFVGDNTSFLKESFDTVLLVLQAYKERQDPSPGIAEALSEIEERLDLAFLLEHIPGAIRRSGEGLRRVANLVRAIKEFAHPDDAHKVPADLNRALTNTLEIVYGQIKHVATVDTKFGDLPSVPCRVGELKQVFLNLIVNAADAIRDVVGKSGAMGSIEVGTRLEGERAVVWIRDTGTGIPAEVAPHIFDPFYTTKEVGKGSGQGLAISRAIVVKHGGAIDFETTAGQGTTFFVRLPLRPA